ncbi:MAG: lysophospholipid acyltransferase family protein [Syntrophomonadaceae bacterium]|nr:lysophospholipid acyltransferase family protein [Syntrophomonadaceae bacterium]MDD3899551.1 lysophospholipid acyltransferase family protein [Syntrophomonadaceae bacterium]
MVYYFVRGICRLLFVFLGLKKEGIDKLPQNGPVIVASNHMSNWDSIMIVIALPRPVHFMAKVELFNNKILGKLLTALHAFPVKRGTADRKAIRQALELLEEGKVLGIFPEGARKKVKPDTQVQSGIALLALKSGAQIVPVACVGTEKDFPLGWFRPLLVRVGDPVDLDKYQGQKISSALLEEVSEAIMQEINSLLDK